MKISVAVIVITGVTAAWLLSWAAPMNPRVDSFISPAPQSVADLLRLTMASPAVQSRYAAHFGLPAPQVLKQFASLKLGKLKKAQTFRVYCYHPLRGEYSYVATLAKNTPVFVTPSGVSVLKADCGNPLTKRYPMESSAKKPQGTHAAKFRKPPGSPATEATLASHPAATETQIPEVVPHNMPSFTTDTSNTELTPKLIPADSTPPLLEPMDIPGTNVPLESASPLAPTPTITTPPTEPGVIVLPEEPGMPGWWLLPGIGGLIGGGGGGGGNSGGAPPPPPDGGGESPPPPPPDGGGDPPPPSIPEPSLVALALPAILRRIARRPLPSPGDD